MRLSHSLLLWASLLFSGVSCTSLPQKPDSPLKEPISQTFVDATYDEHRKKDFEELYGKISRVSTPNMKDHLVQSAKVHYNSNVQGLVPLDRHKEWIANFFAEYLDPLGIKVIVQKTLVNLSSRAPLESRFEEKGDVYGHFDAMETRFNGVRFAVDAEWNEKGEMKDLDWSYECVKPGSVVKPNDRDRIAEFLTRIFSPLGLKALTIEEQVAYDKGISWPFAYIVSEEVMPSARKIVRARTFSSGPVLLARVASVPSERWEYSRPSVWVGSSQAEEVEEVVAPSRVREKPKVLTKYASNGRVMRAVMHPKGPITLILPDEESAYRAFNRRYSPIISRPSDSYRWDEFGSIDFGEMTEKFLQELYGDALLRPLPRSPGFGVNKHRLIKARYGVYRIGGQTGVKPEWNVKARYVVDQYELYDRRGGTGYTSQVLAVYRGENPSGDVRPGIILRRKPRPRFPSSSYSNNYPYYNFGQQGSGNVLMRRVYAPSGPNNLKGKKLIEFKGD